MNSHIVDLNQTLWEKGDFTEIVAFMRQSAEAFIQSIRITPYGPKMNAVEAAKKNGKAAELHNQLLERANAKNCRYVHTRHSYADYCFRLTN